MFFKKIDLVKELEKERQKDSSYNLSKLAQMEEEYQQAASFLYADASGIELLEEAGFTKGIAAKKTIVDHYRKQEVATLIDDGIEKEGIFHKKHIEQISMRYGLLFHYSTNVAILPPKEVVAKIGLLKEKFGGLTENKEEEDSKCKILIICPQKAAYEQTTNQCLLFYKLSEDFYYFCTAWGEPLKADLVDRIKYHYGDRLLVFFEIACIVLMSISLICVAAGLIALLGQYAIVILTLSLLIWIRLFKRKLNSSTDE